MGAANKEHLTYEEYQYWQANFRVEEKDIPTIDIGPSPMLSLKEKVSPIHCVADSVPLT